ncbi:hypothetical protein BDW22DRAFT_1347453, partial [Trametopsis cervina]
PSSRPFGLYWARITPLGVLSSKVIPRRHVTSLRDTWLFKSKRILVIILAGIFGQNAPRGHSATNSRSRAYIWQLKTVTPALIALAATVLVYITAGDSFFVPQPDHKTAVKYNYQQFYDTYLNFMWRKYSPGTVNLIKWYNNQLFAENQLDATASTVVTADDEQIAARMQRLEDSFGTVTVDEPRTAAAPRTTDTAPESGHSSSSSLMRSSEREAVQPSSSTQARDVAIATAGEKRSTLRRSNRKGANQS